MELVKMYGFAVMMFFTNDRLSINMGEIVCYSHGHAVDSITFETLNEKSNAVAYAMRWFADRIESVKGY